MKRIVGAVFAMVVPCVSIYAAAAAQSAGQVSQEAPVNLTQAQLERVVQPIALYPDLLLQQVLAAATFPEQILDAAMYNEQGKDPQGIKDQPWDEAVKGVANYPSVLVTLASDIDWTLTLGSAFINQNEELRKAIQTMRARAKTVGNLNDSSEQNIIEEKGANNTTIIRIEPTNPQVVYVPATTSTTVYEKPVSDPSKWLVPLASFGVGMALGYAMGDHHDDHYYYGGGFYGPGFWYGGPAVNNWVDYRRDRWNDAYDFARDREEWRQDNRDDWREYRQDLGRQQQAWKQERQARGTSWTPEKRAEAQSRLQGARSSHGTQSLEQRRAAFQNSSAAQKARDHGFNQEAASQRLNQARSNGNLSARSESFSRDQAGQRLQQARGNQQLQQRAAQVQSNPEARQRAQDGASRLSQQRAAGGGFSGGGLSGMNRSAASVNRASARGMASRASAGGFSRGGGGRRR
jgi:hypothetical protein